MKKIKKSIGKISLSATGFLYSHYKEKIDRNIERVLKSGWYILGTENKNLESKLANYIGVKHVVTCSSGTDALTLSLKVLDLKKEDEVIVPANVYPTVFGVGLSGVKIRLADVDPETLNINLESIKKVLSKKTKAIVVVHLYGNPVDIDPIKNLAKKNKIYLIEDCAQAMGAVYKNKKVGSFGDLSTFSFYPTKNLAAFGDGGAVGTNSKKFADKIKLLRMYGEKEKYHSVVLGHNSRFDEIQAAIIMAQIDDLDQMNQKRSQIALRYDNALKELPIKLLKSYPEGQSVSHLYVILTKKRKELSMFLEEKGIETAVHYPIPIHMTDTFKYLNNKKGSFPVSEDASQKLISIPVHPFLTEAQTDYICSLIKSFFN